MVPSSLPCCEIRSWSSPWRGVCLNQDPSADTQAEWTNETWQRPGGSLLGLGSWWAYRDMAVYTKLTSLILLLILFCLLLTLVGLPTFRRSISFLNTVRKKRRGGRGQTALHVNKCVELKRLSWFHRTCLYTCLIHCSELISGKLILWSFQAAIQDQMIILRSLNVPVRDEHNRGPDLLHG